MITDDVAPLRHDVEPWFMSGFDFRCVWEALGLDHLPFPLAYRDRHHTYMSEAEADRRAALARQRADLTQNRVRILEALRFPAFVMLGFGRIGYGAAERPYRLFGVIGTTGYCAVITQDPSEQTIFGEDIQIIGCVNVDFPQVVLEALPDYKPGNKPREDTQLEDASPAEFFRDSRIIASILLGGSADFTRDYELRNANYLTLVNVEDDGAYVVNEGTHAFQIIPATVPNLLDTFKKVENLQLKSTEKLSAATKSNRDFNGVS
ncbi:ESX secretion-associated protein EspG [Mycobacterium sp.]|uniref:ESX secretion-associated protein EspG n=1 Tax=Mycobacterium sp. TaxID=1785 RepID=UPI002DA63F5F|nr:ESX secretion-associated protein EspG [Mycobacterium sp.]